jgi:hypothetical protein
MRCKWCFSEIQRDEITYSYYYALYDYDYKRYYICEYNLELYHEPLVTDVCRELASLYSWQ